MPLRYAGLAPLTPWRRYAVWSFTRWVASSPWRAKFRRRCRLLGIPPYLLGRCQEGNEKIDGINTDYLCTKDNRRVAQLVEQAADSR